MVSVVELLFRGLDLCSAYTLLSDFMSLYDICHSEHYYTIQKVILIYFSWPLKLKTKIGYEVRQNHDSDDGNICNEND